MADPQNADDNGGLLNHLYDWATGKMSEKDGAKPQEPNRVPLGDGMADKARQAIKGRGAQIDQAVDDNS